MPLPHRRFLARAAVLAVAAPGRAVQTRQKSGPICRNVGAKRAAPTRDGWLPGCGPALDVRTTFGLQLLAIVPDTDVDLNDGGSVLNRSSLRVPGQPWDFEFNPRHTALVIIDMQNDFCLPGGYCHQYMDGEHSEGDEAIARLREPIGSISRVLEAARAAEVMAIFTVESHWPDLSDVPPNKMEGTTMVGAPIGATGPYGRNLIRGDWGTEVIDELRPLPSEHVLHKPGKGAFVATDFDLILRSRGITHLVFTGITTDCCVLFSRQGARDRGYYTLQLEDCCAASVRENHDAVFNMIRTHPEAFGLMSTSDAVVAALEPALAGRA